MRLFIQLHNFDKTALVTIHKTALVTVHIQSTAVPKLTQKYFPEDKI